MDPSQLQDHTAFEETRVSSAFKDKIVLNETEVLSVGQVVASGTFEEMTDQKQIACLAKELRESPTGWGCDAWFDEGRSAIQLKCKCYALRRQRKNPPPASPAAASLPVSDLCTLSHHHCYPPPSLCMRRMRLSSSGQPANGQNFLPPLSLVRLCPHLRRNPN